MFDICVRYQIPVTQMSYVVTRYPGYHITGGYQITVTQVLMVPMVHDGVSLTYGSPQHIWIFAAGYSEFLGHEKYWICYFYATITIIPPHHMWVDSISVNQQNSHSIQTILSAWVGDGCTASSTCCSFNNPPYSLNNSPALPLMI